MLLYIFIVAVLNICLGFCVAAHLGRRYQGMMESAHLLDLDSALDSSNSPAVVPEDEVAQQDAADEDAVDETQSAPDPPTQKPSEAAAEPAPKKSHNRESIENLIDEVDRYGDRLTDVDEELQSQAEEPVPDSVEACIESLMQATEEYLNNRGAAYRTLQETHEDQPELETMCAELQTAVEEEEKQIESLNATIESLDCRENPKESCREMIDETGKLIEMNGQMQDTLQKVMAGVIQFEQRMESAGPAERDPSQAEILNRVNLESVLVDVWEQDPGRDRQLCVAMVDLDHFEKINKRFGEKAGDKVLRTIARFLKSDKLGESKMTQSTGQRFTFIFPDVDIRFTTNLVEQFRQSIEMIHFLHQEFDIRVTLSCAVVEASKTDTTDTLLSRAETTLKEAKRYGRNRTFLHDGKYPTPVVPPVFTLEEREITI